MSPEITQFAIIGGMIVVFYLFFIRPQQTKAKEGKSFLEELKKGDKIVTTGGIHGRIVKDDVTSFLVEVDTNTKMRFDKGSVSMELTKLALEAKTDSAK